jgi:LysR family nitrogen assimilation transcriptional regulator
MAHTEGDYFDLDALQHFVTLADAIRTLPASVTTSPAEPLVKPAAVTQLERDLGVDLAHWQAHPPTLTESGKRLHKYAQELLDRYSAAVESVAYVVRNPAEQVVLAIPPTVSAVLASPVSARFREMLPTARLRVIDGMSGHIREWLGTNQIDVGVLYESHGSSDERLWSEKMYLVADASLVPLWQKHIALEALSTIPLVLPSTAHGLRQLVQRKAEQHSVKLNITIEADGLNTMLDLVLDKLCATILPIAAVQTYHRSSPTLRCIPIKEPDIIRHLVISTGTNKHKSSASRMLAQIVREEAHKIKASLAF